MGVLVKENCLNFRRAVVNSNQMQGKENYTLQVLSSDVSETITALGRASCVLVGHDWGAAVGWITVSRCGNLNFVEDC